MDTPWGSDISKKFVTNLGIITSTGPNGENIMTAEWTRHVSYSPGMVMINIVNSRATYDNIKETKEFGINIASDKQGMVAFLAGGSSGKDVNKIALIKEQGATFYQGNKIKAPMLHGAALNLECKLVKHEVVGDHIMVVGEVLDANVGKDDPIVFYGGQFRKMGAVMPPLSDEQKKELMAAMEKHKRKK
jgi:flavin reductase (DIM6/NTAB) family NADH-FMN oxidoreductase RutF